MSSLLWQYSIVKFIDMIRGFRVTRQNSWSGLPGAQLSWLPDLVLLASSDDDVQQNIFQVTISVFLQLQTSVTRGPFLPQWIRPVVAPTNQNQMHCSHNSLLVMLAGKASRGEPSWHTTRGSTPRRSHIFVKFVAQPLPTSQHYETIWWSTPRRSHLLVTLVDKPLQTRLR